MNRGEYKLDDLIDVIGSSSGKYLKGIYNSEEIYLKKGKYGLYINLNGKNKSVNNINKPIMKLQLQMSLKLLNQAFRLV